ncbi:MAG: NAD(P)H-binding protein [Synergistaceae bacterium]|jgi:putative NADH-flavin reductase|nr:NAD(P)H-binding protein [Synergistaceae bacterium]
MKIAIIGANGREGRLLVREALSRGHDVLAIIHKHSDAIPPAARILVKNIFDLTYRDVKNYEVIIDAFGAWEPALLQLHGTSLKHLADMLSGKHNRLIVVGCNGSLFVDKEHTTLMLDSPDMPLAYGPLARAMNDAFYELQKRGDINWTYMSPPALFDAEGLKTGKYRAGLDDIMFNSRGMSVISYADAAIALIDETESAKHVKERFTVVGE